MALVVGASFFGSFGAVFLKSGSEQLRHGLRYMLNWKLGLGVLLFVLSSLFFVRGIKHGEISVLYPMASLGYIWTLVWSRLVFGERFTKAKLAGLGLIILGVCFVGMGNG